MTSVPEPPWRLTFPHIIHPIAEEWLPGVLLRCDGINEWPNGTTLRLIYERAQRRAVFAHVNYCAPTRFPYQELADGLGVPLAAIIATTYLTELQRLFPQAVPHPAQLGPFQRRRYRLCPECVHQGILPRFLALPGLTLCPAHGLVLQDHCRCSAPICYDALQVMGYQCATCLLPWVDLPRCHGSAEVCLVEASLYCLYHYVLREGTATLLATVWHGIHQWLIGQQMDRLPLHDGTWLSTAFTSPRDSFSLYRVLASVMSLERHEPGWCQAFGLPTP